MGINKELEESKKYCFDMEKNIEIVKLTLKNVALAEAMMRNDSSYYKSGKIEAAPKGQYKGSSAYWFNRIKN